MNRVNWTKKALKQLKAIDNIDQAMVYEAVGALIAWPNCRNVKALIARKGYRLRAGRYRVLFDIVDGKPRIITIQEVLKRDGRTY